MFNDGVGRMIGYSHNNNYKGIRTSYDQILIESYNWAGDFKRALTQYLEPVAWLDQSIKCKSRHHVIIEGFTIEEVNQCLEFYKGTGAICGYMIEWGLLDE